MMNDDCYLFDKYKHASAGAEMQMQKLITGRKSSKSAVKKLQVATDAPYCYLLILKKCVIPHISKSNVTQK